MNQYLSQLYATDTYSQNTGGWLPNEDEAKAATILRVLRKAQVFEGVKSILDVGCGIGGILRHVHAQLMPGVRGLGIDLSSIAIDMAKKDPILGLEFKAIPLAEVEGCFDLIVLSHVLEHVPDWDKFLSEIVSKTGSFIYLNVPLEVNVVSAMRGRSLLDTYRKYGHIHFFDEGFLIAYLKDCGFEIIAKDYGEEFMVQTSTLRGKIARLPRWILGRFSKKIASRILGGYSLALLCMPPSPAVK